MRGRGAETDYMAESKLTSGDQSAQQQHQSLMSSVYPPTNNYLYHDVDHDCSPVILPSNSFVLRFEYSFSPPGKVMQEHKPTTTLKR